MADLGRWRPAPTTLIGSAAVVGAALVVLPDLARIDSVTPFAQLVAGRPLLGVLTLTVALGAAMRHRWRGVAAGLAIVALVGGGLVVPRMINTSEAGAGREGELVVLALNVYRGRADPMQLAELIRTHRPDLVALLEAGPQFRASMAQALADTSYVIADFGSGTEVGSVSVAVHASLGDVDVSDAIVGTYPHVEVTGGELGQLRFVAFHAVAPVPSTVGQWAADLRGLRRWCSAGTPTVVAGDLNATLDHSVLRSSMIGCTDSAALLGRGLEATWPSSLPRPLGIQIDHVLTTDGVRATRFEVFDVAGTDHRGVLTTLTRASPPALMG